MKQGITTKLTRAETDALHTELRETLQQARETLDDAIQRAEVTEEYPPRIDDPLADLQSELQHAYTLMWILHRNGHWTRPPRPKK